MDRAERAGYTRLTVITSGLQQGLKHSMSRDFLNSEKIYRQKKSKSMESLSRIQQTEILVTAEVHQHQARQPPPPRLVRSGVQPPIGQKAPPPPKRPKRQSSTHSSVSSSFCNRPTYAPSIGSRRDSNASLVSSTVETAAYIARTSFRRSEAAVGVAGGGFKVCVCVSVRVKSDILYQMCVQNVIAV